MRDMRNVAMGASLLIAALMLAGKLSAYFLTGSTAILSDVIESVVHIVATGLAAFSLWFSRQSACEKHPYGHGKIAYFSAGFEGAVILSAAVFIFYAGVIAMLRRPELRELHLGIVITAFLALVNLGLGLFLIRVGRRHNALILVANGKHVLADMWTSAGVVVGVSIVWLTQMAWFDPIVALLVGLNILYAACTLMWKSFRGLLDEAEPEKTQRLLQCLQRCVDSKFIHGFHQLRHRQADNVMWVEVHMLLPGDMDTAEAHKRVTHVEEIIRGEFPTFQLYVTSHFEPVLHERAHPLGHPGIKDPYSAGASPRGQLP